MDKLSNTLNLGLKGLFILIGVVFLMGMMGMMQDMRQPVVRNARQLDVQPEQRPVYSPDARRLDQEIEQRRSPAAVSAPKGEDDDPQIDVIDDDTIEVTIGDLIILEHTITVISNQLDKIKQLPMETYSVGWVVEVDPEIILARRRWNGNGDDNPEWHNFVRIKTDQVLGVEKLR